MSHSKEGLIFNGAELAVKSFLDRPGPNVIISFSARSDRPTMSGFGEPFFEKRGIPAVHVISKRNHWWQVEEISDTIKAILALNLNARFKKVITYGTSMGGHGALVLSGPLHADQVFAFSPQFAINGRGAPWPTRWQNDTFGQTDILAIEDSCSRTAEIIVGYDPFLELDRLHMSQIQAVRSLRIIPIPFAGHSAMLALQQQGLLSTFLSSVARGDFDVGKAVSALKDSRRMSLTYWYGLGVKASQRARFKTTSEEAFSKAEALAFERLKTRSIDRQHALASFALRRMSQKLTDSGDREGACSVAEQYAASYPDIPEALALLRDVHWSQGNFDAALLPARRALKLQRKNVPNRLRLACLYLLLDDKASATEHFKAALLQWPGKDGKAWNLAVQYALKHDVDRDMIKKLAAQALKLRPDDPKAKELHTTAYSM